jgi:hypothetical protein
MTARMGVSVGRLPQEVLLEEFYRSECSETVRVGRVRAFEELLTVLTFWSAIKFHREYRTRVCYSSFLSEPGSLKRPALLKSSKQNLVCICRFTLAY